MTPPPRQPKIPAPSALSPAKAIATARAAGLRHVSDAQPGITRERGRARGGQGKGATGGDFDFIYRDPRGKTVAATDVLARIRRLAIPPAWAEVWICPSPHGHIQATGRDARGRKQYRYHADWSEVRDGAKFERMRAFGRALPRIRRGVENDLARRRLDQRKVLAAVVRLLETTLIRVGNEEYARENRSFGLSTLRNRHVTIGRGVLHFQFLGKSGKQHRIDLHDPRLARVVRRTRELPGQELFEYLDARDRPQKIDSGMVNDYLHGLAGAEFSAKDFRTWAATVQAAVALRAFERCTSLAQAKRNVIAAIDGVAHQLGNTPSICRKSYIHPLVMERYLAGQTIAAAPAPSARRLPRRRNAGSLTAEETAVLAFLDTRRGRASENLR